jgi:hypothetical protein
MPILKFIIEKFKLNELIAIVFLICCLMIFMPIEYMKFLKLYELKTKYQMYISIGFLLTSSYFFVRFISWINRGIKYKINNSEKRAINYMMNKITPEEMAFLIYTFYDSKNKKFRTMGYIEYSNGLKTPLEYYNIIYRSSNISRGYEMEFAYNLQPYISKFLNKNLENGNIDLENGTYILEK